MKMATRVRAVALLIIGSLLAGMFCLTGCEPEPTRPPHRPTVEEPTKAPTQKTIGVLTNIDLTHKNLSFIRLEEGKAVIYPYTGATYFYSRAGVSIAPQQLAAGDVVDITYETTTNKVVKVQKSSSDKLMENTKVTNFAVNEADNTMRIANTLYRYDEQTLVYCDGQQIDIRELNNSMDELHVCVYGSRVVSITINKSHGYLALSGDSLFIGGWISVGGVLARVIEKDMLLAVTEGTYKVQVENGNYSSEKEVTITRGKKTVLDFSDVLAEVQEVGNIRFFLTPAHAILTIDGEEYDANRLVEKITAGKHTIEVTCAGYDPYKQVHTIKGEYQQITINLTGGEEVTEPATSAPATETTAPTSEVTNNKVTVKGPVGASIYFDGKFVGAAPVSFPLVTGPHVITVLDGMKIHSYSVTLAGGADDVEYDFSE